MVIKNILLTVGVLLIASLANATTAELMCREGEAGAIVEAPAFVFLVSTMDADGGSASGKLHANDINDFFVDGEINYARDQGKCILKYDLKTSSNHTVQFNLPVVGAKADQFFDASVQMDGKKVSGPISCAYVKTPVPATCEEVEAEEAATRTSPGVNEIYGFEIEKCGPIVDRAYGQMFKDYQYCDKRALCDVKLPSGGTISAFANLFCECSEMRADSTKCAKDNSVRNLEAFRGLNAKDKSRPKTRVALPPNMRDKAK
jgi:hypothetical protein